MLLFPILHVVHMNLEMFDSLKVVI